MTLWEAVMPARRKRHASLPAIEVQDEYHALVATWMLRMLLGSGAAFRSFFDAKRGFRDSDVSDFLGLQDVDEHKVRAGKLKKIMSGLLAGFEGVAHQHYRCSSLSRNIGLLAERVSLTLLEQEVLAFAVLRDRCEALVDCLRLIPRRSETQFVSLMAKATGVSMEEMRAPLSRTATLLQSGMIKFDTNSRGSITLCVSDRLTGALMAHNDDVHALLRHFLVPARPATLRAGDYPHIRTDLDILKRLLKTTLQTRDKGVNILLYGSPGTGKTELARLLARKLKAALFEVRTEDGDGDLIRANSRLEAYRFCQQMLACDRCSIILFDEVEDVFPARAFSLFGLEMRSGNNKGWINRALEENPTPAIWVCNRISQIDPAFLRRFDYALELNTPPRTVRLNIVRSRLKHAPVSEGFMQRLAEHESLSPAQVAKAAQVLKRLHCRHVAEAEAALERVLGGSIKAMGQKPLPRRCDQETHYDLGCLNANADIPSLVAGLKRSGRGSICFHGPPGTGKTALGQYIARHLERPLLAKRASDILSCWVGESEKNIARMFAQAERENAVLLLDEADSFLRDRRGADHSWEVTQVNELLVQMEHFDGLFICSTNLMDDLDQASLRRFAIKVEFDYLKPEQAWRMLRKECVDRPSEQDRRSIMALRNLTPGDFAAVKKRLSILGQAAMAAALIAGLKDECRCKQDNTSNAIGFLGQS